MRTKKKIGKEQKKNSFNHYILISVCVCRCVPNVECLPLIHTNKQTKSVNRKKMDQTNFFT